MFKSNSLLALLSAVNLLTDLQVKVPFVVPMMHSFVVVWRPKKMP